MPKKKTAQITTASVSHSTPATPPVATPAPTPNPNPSFAWVASALTQLDPVVTILGANASPLSIADRRRLAKLRPGADALAQSTLSLADQYGVVIPGVTHAAVNSDVLLLQELTPLLSRLQSMLALVSDARGEAQSRITRQLGTAYATLTRLVPQFPSLQGELHATAAFFATKHKDAPSALRKQESKSLAQQRRTRKEKRAAAALPTPASSPPPLPVVAPHATSPQVAAVAPPVTAPATVSAPPAAPVSPTAAS